MGSDNTPIYNVHTHLFTKDHTPKYLGKKIIPWPFYLLLDVPAAVTFIKRLLNQKSSKVYTHTSRNREWRIYKLYMAFERNSLLLILKVIRKLILLLIWLYFIYYLFELILQVLTTGIMVRVMHYVLSVLEPIVIHDFNYWIKGVIIVVILLVFTSIRKTFMKFFWNQVKKLLGEQQIEFLLRYLNLVHFSNMKNMSRLFSDMKDQYPPDTKFVILPMDMKYMDAGDVKESYVDQMSSLMKLKAQNKDILYPFIFVDPRRIVDEGNQFFGYSLTKYGKVELDDKCDIKHYLTNGFCGIKIYPALGYYPFDKALLPLWKYCADNNIPITTHCSVGPIYYRGKKRAEWDEHPIFKEQIGSSDEGGVKTPILSALRLTDRKNKDFQKAFTHPMNYLCLLQPELLKDVLDVYDDKGLNDIFGYDGTTIKYDLRNLKINLAHYGGSENWDRYLSKDRYDYSNKILSNPNKGLEFTKKHHSIGFMYNCWHYVDWYSIISSMMIEYPNVYTDVSYTTHETKYLPLLSCSLENSLINKKVLFGTDFYVVSNWTSEKQYYMETKYGLPPHYWDAISNRNPGTFLSSCEE